jgi:hypothetical protein
MPLKIERKPLGLGGAGKGKINRVRPGERAPDFDSLFDPSGIRNPLAKLKDTGDPTQNGEQEISATLAAIKAEKKERRDQYRTLTDPNFYLVVCFQSTDQKNEFLQKSGWAEEDAKYLDGLELAARLGVDVQPINLPRKSTRPAPKALRGHEFIEPESE